MCYQLSPFISQGVQSVINRMSHKIIHSIKPVAIIKPSEWEKPPDAKAWLGLAMERLAREFHLPENYLCIIILKTNTSNLKHHTWISSKLLVSYAW